MSPFGGPLSSLCYTSRSVHQWTEADWTALAEGSQNRNLALGVTGRLLCFEGRFIQVLEGHGHSPRDLYLRIVRDERHTEVVLLFDATVEARSYPAWSMDVLRDHELGSGPVAGLRTQGQRTTSQSFSVWQAMLNGIGTLERSVVSADLKTRPQQDRAKATLERLLDAGSRVILRVGVPDATIEAVAEEANVSVKTAYRYFSSTDQIASLWVRRWQTRQLAAFAMRLAGLRVGSVDELAAIIVDHVSGTYLRNDRVPLRIRQMALRKYHRIAYAELWSLAGMLLATMDGNGLPISDPGLHGRIAMALAGLGAQAKMAALHDPSQLQHAYFTTEMTGMLSGAMQYRGSDPPARGPHAT